MGKAEKTLSLVLRGTSDANVLFQELFSLLRKVGFSERVRGDHFIYTKEGVEEILNLEPIGGEAKVYQEALKNAEVIIGEWLETAQELGRPIPEPREK
jgi:hypothetical protein